MIPLQPSVDPALEEALATILMCAPSGICPRETYCFRIARYARDKLRQEYAQAGALPVADPDEVADYAPHLTGCHAEPALQGPDVRIGGWDAA